MNLAILNIKKNYWFLVRLVPDTILVRGRDFGTLSLVVEKIVPHYQITFALGGEDRDPDSTFGIKTCGSKSKCADCKNVDKIVFYYGFFTQA